METIYYIHVFFTIFLTGLVWFVQVVHYPMFNNIPSEQWVSFEKEHVRRTTWVTLYPMLAEAVTGLILLYIWYTKEVSDLMLYAMIGNAILSITIWLSTFLIQVPLHQRLQHAYDPKMIMLLNMTNWYRVLIWTIRSVLVLYLIPLL